MSCTLLLATVLAQPVTAADWYKYQLNTDDSLSWRDPGHVLKLHSDSATGITVSKTSPGLLWGLQQGDAIVAVDDHPVQHVSELLTRLRASKPAAVKLQLRRGMHRWCWRWLPPTMRASWRLNRPRRPRHRHHLPGGEGTVIVALDGRLAR
jgi:membrane-associated protease RseP (regulator of RpoE activity)